MGQARAGHTLRHLEEGGDLIHQAEELVQQVDAIHVEDRTLSEIVRWSEAGLYDISKTRPIALMEVIQNY
jgi:hypothetical protein